MEKIEEKFLLNKNIVSDINEHLDVLHEYALKCDHITEMGIRWGSSTWAFLMSNPKKLIGYDITQTEEISEIINICSEYNMNFTFLKEDVLKITIDETDLLFIDTLHTYNQLINELNLHSSKVKNYIILHDTVSFGQHDEIIYEHASDLIKEQSVNKQGLVSAIQDFLNSESGKSWVIEKEFQNNNGLTILKKWN
jgi:hypothetical protein